MLFFWTFYSSKNPEKKKNGFEKKIWSMKLFSTLIIIRNVYCAVNQYMIMISEDHVTLKTEVMMLETQLFITGINYILQYIQIENRFYIVMFFSTILLFLLYFRSNKCSLCENYFKKHNKSTSKALKNYYSKLLTAKGYGTCIFEVFWCICVSFY